MRNNTVVNPDVDNYTKTRSKRNTAKKLPKNAKKQQPTENQKNGKCGNKS